MKNNTKNTISISIITILEKVLGLIKTLLLSFYYGTSAISDVFNVIVIAPDTLYAILGNGVPANYIPVATRLDQEKRNTFTSNLIILFSCISFIICIVVSVFPSIVSTIFSPGFQGGDKRLAEQLIRISIWSIGFMIINQLFTCYLQMKKRFISSSISTLFLGLAQCISIILSFKLSSVFLATGMLFGSILQTLFLIPLSVKEGLRFSIKNFEGTYVWKFIVLSIPVIVSTSASRINVIVDKAIASFFPAGSISALSYADILVLFVKSIIAIPIITVAFPDLAKAVSKNDNYTIEEVLTEGIISIAVLLIPITFGTFVCSKEIVDIVYSRGSFDLNATLLTSECLRCYIIGLFFVSIRDLFVKLFYAYNDTKTPTINVILGIVLNLCLNLMLSRFIGVPGLAIASSITSFIICTLMIVSAIKHVHFSALKNCMKKLALIIVASIIMALVVHFVKTNFLVISNFLNLVVCTITGIIVYFTLIFLFKVLSLENIKILINRR